MPFVFLLCTSLSVLGNPFHPRDYNRCVDFKLTHQAQIISIIDTVNQADNLYMIEIQEPYFSWHPIVLQISKNSPKWQFLRVGDKVSVDMNHTTSDVPLMNKVIEEGFSHAFLDSNLNYAGFLIHPLDIVKEISLQTHEDTGELGPFKYYLLYVRFLSGEEIQVPSSYISDLNRVAKPGDQIIIANGFYQHDHHYPQPSPFGNKRVIQKHRLGHPSSLPVYQRHQFPSVLFNITRGTASTLWTPS